MNDVHSILPKNKHTGKQQQLSKRQLAETMQEELLVPRPV